MNVNKLVLTINQIDAANMIKKIIFIFLLLPSLVFANHTSKQKIPLEVVVGQMMMVGFDGTTINENSPIVQEIKTHHIGGVLIDDHYYVNGKIHPRNIENPKQLKKLIQQLQFFAKKYDVYPLFIAVNQEGGKITALKSSKGFKNANDPSQAALGKENNKKYIYEKTLERATLLKNIGINVNLAPVADLNINPNNPAIGKLERSFGAEVDKVTDELHAAIKAYNSVGILCTLKHFPGFGTAKANTDYAVTDVTASWQENELLPYKKLISENAACPFIMTSHLINKRLDKSGLPVSFSKKVVTNLLRQQMNYKGLIITDDLDALAISNHFSFDFTVKQSVLAGNNVLIYDGTQGHDAIMDSKQLFATLLKLAKTNPQARAKVIESYERIMATKQMMVH